MQPGFSKDQEAQMRSWMASALAEALSNTGQSGPSGLQPQSQDKTQPGTQAEDNGKLSNVVLV